MEDTLKQLHDMSIFKGRMPHLQHLRLNSMSPSQETRSQSPSLRSPTLSSNSGIASSQTASVTRHRAENVPFTHFLGIGAKSEKKARKGASSSQTGPSSDTNISGTDKLRKQEEKQRKAEEKSRKKAEAKAKTDRLAMELKEKAIQRAAALEKVSLHSGRSSDRRPQWVDGPSMYGALGSL
jgi:hypothetical protein